MASVTHQALLMIGGAAATAPPGGGWFAPLATVAPSVVRDRFLQARADASSYANAWLHPIAAVVTVVNFGWTNRLATVAPRIRDAGLIDPSSYANAWLRPPIASYPLDGLTATAAWSVSRALYTSYIGGTLYTTATGIDVLNDQTGNARNMLQSTALRQPAVTTAGPNGIACADFDGSDDFFSTAAALSNFIAAGSGYMIASIYIDTLQTNVNPPYANDMILLDLNQYAGMTVRVGNLFYANNYVGGNTEATGTITTGTPYVVEWRHESSLIYQRVNGAGETSTSSGDTGSLAAALYMGARGALAQPFNGKIFEAVTFSSIPTQLQRDALVQDFGLYVGAAV